jgi:membrane protein
VKIPEIKKKLDYLLKLLLNPIVKISKKIVLPGFDKLPLYDVAEFFLKGLWNGQITTRASSIAFNFFVAIFPAVIFFFTLIPYMPVENLFNTVMAMVKSSLPEQTFSAVSNTIEEIVLRQHNGLLSFGFIFALYYSSNGIRGLITGFNSTYHTIETRAVVMQYLISVLLVIILSLVILFSSSLYILGTSGLRYLVTEGILGKSFTYYLISYGKWVLIVIALFLGISFIYYLAPAKKERFRFISAGGSLATALILLTTWGFKFYIDNFGKYNILYGSIGAFIVLLMWLYLNAIVMLVGFELNASILQAGKRYDRLDADEVY